MVACFRCLRAIISSMISQLRGEVVESRIGYMILDVGGVGYKINTSMSSIVGEQVSIWTHLAVRENSMDLYGFKSSDGLSLFEMLISVSGIGPKSALATLSLASVKTLKGAISSGDTSYLTKVSGIGKKTAQKIVLELKEKIGESKSINLSGAADAVEVLRSLGYSKEESRDVIQKVDPSVVDIGERVKMALKILGGGND